MNERQKAVVSHCKTVIDFAPDNDDHDKLDTKIMHLCHALQDFGYLDEFLLPVDSGGDDW
ncbi:MAG: hypothetical protein ACR2NF_05190 [Pirellulales bacterium]